MHPLRIWAVAANSFRGALRDRLLYFVAVFALILGLGARLLPEVAALTEDKMLLDLGLGAIAALSLLFAVFAGASTLAQDIERRTVLAVLTKPLSRAELVLGKHLGLWGALAVAVMLMGLVYLLLLHWLGLDYPLGALILALVFLLLELGLVVAIALTFSVFTGSTLASLLTFCTYLLGTLSRDWVELGKLSENATIETVTRVLYLVLPDLARLNLRNQAVYGLLPSPSELVAHGVYGCVYISTLLAIATLVFSRRQF